MPNLQQLDGVAVDGEDDDDEELDEEGREEDVAEDGEKGFIPGNCRSPFSTRFYVACRSAPKTLLGNSQSVAAEVGKRVEFAQVRDTDVICELLSAEQMVSRKCFVLQGKVGSFGHDSKRLRSAPVRPHRPLSPVLTKKRVQRRILRRPPLYCCMTSL